MSFPGMDPKIQVQVDPNEDTEWNDILRDHGIIPQKEPDPTEQLEEALSEALQRQHENRLEGLDIDELEELEGLEDDEFLESYKNQRMNEIKRLQQEKSKNYQFGDVYHINKPEYAKEVTEASKSVYVVLIMSGNNLQSRVINEVINSAARKFKDVKFVEIQGSRAVENYPEANLPTILVYHDTNVVKQYITLTMLSGNQTSLKDLEKLLVDVGAVGDKDDRLLVNQDLDDDLEDERRTRFTKKSMRGKAVDDDDDDDFFD
ncbi:unnamed protein product [Ambrosiozyma monospora]|uniref:Unnamed protein product n=1 Tax=Ambrosiozyma monospora TaxID=43982 RepID=A0A9W7DDZ7_AMBMO|nr:unnamed protein product [Ambrosiozyma monospora]